MLLRDEVLIALDKPAGRIVVPGRGEAAGERPLRDDAAAAAPGRIFVVHRLDRDTSGVVVFARTALAHRTLSRAFETRQVEKRYLALCRGELIGSGEVARALVPVRGGRSRAARPDETGGKPSRSLWRAVERFPGFTLVEWRPLTGRLHQIRVHAALLGFPLAVDPVYGGADVIRLRDVDPRATGPQGDDPVLRRVPLHACRLRFPHPTTGETVSVEAPLPDDLADLLALLAEVARRGARA